MKSLIYLTQVTACSAVFYLFYYLLLSRLTFFAINRWYLLITVILSFVIPAIKLPVSEPHVYTGVVQQVVKVYIPDEVPIINQAPVSQRSAIETDPLKWDYIVNMAYLTIMLAFSIHLIIMLYAFCKRIKGKRITKLGNVNILSSNNKVANGSFLNYIFLNDTELNADEIQQVIAHEMLHIKLVHSADRIIVKIAQIILWFNPFIYLYARSVEENHEFEVDKLMAVNNDKHNYANLLLHLSVAGNGMLYHNFSKVPLKKRITMLFNQPSNNMRKIIYVLVLPVLLISCLAFAQQQKEATNAVKPKKSTNGRNKVLTSNPPLQKQKVLATTKTVVKINATKPLAETIDNHYYSDLYSRVEVKKDNGDTEDSLSLNSRRLDGRSAGGVVTSIKHNAIVRFLINRTLYSEAAFKRLSPETQSRLLTARATGVAAGDSYKTKLKEVGYSDKVIEDLKLAALFYIEVKDDELTPELKTPAGNTKYGQKQSPEKATSVPASYNNTEDGKRDANMRNAIMGKIVTVTVKAIDVPIDIDSKSDNKPTSGVVFDYNGNEYSILCWTKPERELKKQLKAGDVITMKISAAGSGNGMPVFIIPAYVIKNNVKIYEVKNNDPAFGSVKSESPGATLADIKISRADKVIRTNKLGMQLYGNVRLNIGDTRINADYVRVDDNKHLLFASGQINSKTQTYLGLPVAEMGKNNAKIICDSLVLNYQTMTSRVWNSKAYSQN